MSKFLTTLAILFFSFSLSFNLAAQTEETPNAIGFKVLFLDYFTPNSGPAATLNDISNGFEISYHRYLNKYLDIAAPLRFGVIDLSDEIDNKSLVGLDALLKVKYYKENSLIIPYFFTGGGYVLEETNKGHFQVPAGIGFNFLAWKRAFINIQAGYRYSPVAERNNLELGLGFIVNLGEIEEEILDSDGDGILDPADKCPNQKGPQSTMGCPDKDKDGFADQDDKCPEIPGTEDGCPPEEEKIVDSDGDGVADDEDLCPEQAGVAALGGCPDRDNDGVEDRNDNCPDTAGLLKFNGCPDSDNDGVADPNDKCPTTAGPSENFGCPEIKQEEKDILALAMRDIRFETGKAALKPSSFRILDQISEILKRYPDYNVSIAGHTDSVGSEESNLILSEERAKSCYSYLLTKGISAQRISFVGHGESLPINSNKTREGRMLNRRVEFNLYLE